MSVTYLQDKTQFYNCIVLSGKVKEKEILTHPLKG